MLASLSETLLATETRGLLAALLEWGAGLQAVLEFARLGVHFLETFDGEGYGAPAHPSGYSRETCPERADDVVLSRGAAFPGDSQSTLLQYAQISACLQLLLRQQSVRHRVARYLSHSRPRLTRRSLPTLDQLERTNLGSVDGRSISAAFFGQASTAYLLAALSEDEKDLLSGWITALFGSEGIADDLLQ